MSSVTWWKADHEVFLNSVQRAAVSWYFNPNNRDGEPWPLDTPLQIGIDHNQLVINGAYLHSDGEWATFHEAYGPQAQQVLRRLAIGERVVCINGGDQLPGYVEEVNDTDQGDFEYSIKHDTGKSSFWPREAIVALRDYNHDSQ